MRSRYSAFAKGLADYLIRTTDPDGEAYEEDTALWRKSLLQTAKSHSFPGVIIHETGPDFVYFTARIFQGVRDVSFSERSHFVRRDGRWLYHDGAVEE